MLTTPYLVHTDMRAGCHLYVIRCCYFHHRAQAGKTDELAISHKGVNLQANTVYCVYVCVCVHLLAIV